MRACIENGGMTNIRDSTEAYRLQRSRGFGSLIALSTPNKSKPMSRKSFEASKAHIDLVRIIIEIL